MTTVQTLNAENPLAIQLENGKCITLQGNTSVPGDFDAIPVVDVSRMHSDKLEDRQALAAELADVCANVGFFYAKNHGIPQETINETFDWGKKFFHELSEDEKMKCFTGLLPEGSYQGYFPFLKKNSDGRKNPDLVEAFNFSYELDQDPLQPPPSDELVEFANLWPENFPGFKEKMFNYHKECLNLSRKLVRIFALALGVEEDFFDSMVTYPSASMRITHYPVQTVSEEDQNGLGAHTDFQFFTLVNPGQVSGLQVLNKSGKWIQAPPMEGCLVVNIADVLMRMSNDRFVSTVHRVVNASGELRYSVPFFFGLNGNVLMEPIRTCISEDNPFKYKVESVSEYINWRSALSKKNKF